MEFLTQENISIVVLDDDAACADAIKLLLNSVGMNNVKDYTDPHKLLEDFSNEIRIAIIDQNLNSDLTGLDVIKKIVERYRYVCFIMLSGQDSMDVPIDFMNATYDSCKYVRKAEPRQNELLIEYVNRAVKQFQEVAGIYSGFNKVDSCLERLDNIIDRKPLENGAKTDSY